MPQATADVSTNPVVLLSDPQFQRELTKQALNILEKAPSGKVESAFARSNGVQFIFRDEGDGFRDELAEAVVEKKTVMLERGSLALELRNYIQRTGSLREGKELLAAALAGDLAHEINHLRTYDDLKKQGLGSFRMSSIEDEALADAQQARVVREIRRQYPRSGGEPQTDRQEQVQELLTFSARGYRGTEQFAQASTGFSSFLQNSNREATRLQLQARLERDRKTFGARSGAEAAETLEKIEQTALVVADPKAFSKVLDYLQKRVNDELKRKPVN